MQNRCADKVSTPFVICFDGFSTLQSLCLCDVLLPDMTLLGGALSPSLTRLEITHIHLDDVGLEALSKKFFKVGAVDCPRHVWLLCAALRLLVRLRNVCEWKEMS